MRPLLAFLGCRGVIKRKNKYHLGITLAIYTHGSKYGVWGGMPFSYSGSSNASVLREKTVSITADRILFCEKEG